jgi:uncharacterized membrane protein
MTGITNFVKNGLVIIMFVLLIYVAYFISSSTYNFPAATYFPEVKANADPWYSRVILPGEMNSTAWIKANTNTTDKFVADIFGMTDRVSTVGGDWANAPDPIKDMSDSNTVYTTDDPQQAYNIAVEDNCSYIYLPNRDTFSGYSWVYGNHTKFDDTQYFQLVYQNPDVSIYKVLK